MTQAQGGRVWEGEGRGRGEEGREGEAGEGRVGDGSLRFSVHN